MLSLELRVIEGSLKLREKTPRALNTIKKVCNDLEEERQSAGYRRHKSPRKEQRRGMLWQELEKEQHLIIDYDESNHKLMVKLMDSVTHELIKILDDDEAKAIIKSLGQVTGLIIDAYA